MSVNEVTKAYKESIKQNQIKKYHDLILYLTLRNILNQKFHKNILTMTLPIATISADSEMKEIFHVYVHYIINLNQ